MKFLAVSPEAGEWTQPSPLAGAVNYLTRAYARSGTEMLTCSPFYPAFFGNLSDYTLVYKGVEKLRDLPFEVWRGKDPLHSYIRFDEYFGRSDVYGTAVPYADNHLRFSFLVSAALAYCEAIHFDPNGIWGHDWGGALAGPIAKNTYKEAFGTLPFFFTVHNITYDFHVPESEIEKIGLPRKDFNMDGYEFWGKVSILKTGIFYATKVLLPSPGYREALLGSSALSGGLSGFLNRNKDKLKGIQFGLNYSFWDFNYEAKRPIGEAKKAARAALERELGISFGGNCVIYCNLEEESSRTAETLATIIADVMKLNAFVIIGTKENSEAWNYYRSIAERNPSRMKVVPVGTNEILRERLAGSDILFAANLREPSASLVLKALAAGTVPLTGKDVGCANLLSDYCGNVSQANAMLVDDAAAPDQMLRRLKDATDIYATVPAFWAEIVNNAYLFRYEWDRTIAQYLLTFGEA